jgi:GT2 family glycosyltransferase
LDEEVSIFVQISMQDPTITVVVTSYTLDRYQDFQECIESLLAQTYDRYDIVVVAESAPVQKRVRAAYDTVSLVTVVPLEGDANLATARNKGATAAEGEVVAFIDDDAVAAPDWLAQLAAGYAESEYDAVGGVSTPRWVDDRAGFLPEEFYFLVGATHAGFADGPGEVRNTFGCNISFTRERFHSLGGFNTELGKNHGHNLQAEETELCARLREQTGTGVYYAPAAQVEHKVHAEQTTLRWLVDRAYWQGVSKAVVDESTTDGTDEEWGFLQHLVTRSVPSYLTRCLGTPLAVVQLLALVLFTAVVGTGFARGKLTYA